MKKLILFLLTFFTGLSLFAQQSITGNIIDTTAQQPVAAATVMLKDGSLGTYTNEFGQFNLTVHALPITLVISAVGYTTKVITVDSKEPLSIAMAVSSIMEPALVMAPTRFPIRQLASPVSIERFGVRDFRSNPSPNYYDMALYAKGVDVTTSSLTFKTYSTRGFNYSGSARVNQVVDGMDNQAPGLNFYVGNFSGLTELDVESIEILPGASSALYGAGGMNGTILINSKSPFKYQGLSVLMKEGAMNLDKSQRPDVTAYHDFSLRYAKAFNNRFAFKVGFQYLKATDWLANDTSNYSRLGDVGQVIPGTRNTDPNYDGVNVYGDETSVNLGTAQTPFYVSRTGYQEKDVISPETKNLKLSGALHYKLSANTEALIMGYWGTGNSVYTGNNRYALKDIKIGQYKVEVKNKNWFLRGYTTQEDAGKAYSATIAMQVFNELWKPSATWYQQFGLKYATRALLIGPAAALLEARQTADQGRPEPGSEQFKTLFEKAVSIAIPNGGLFLEKSQLWVTEGQYHFSHLIPHVDVVVGGDWKQYVLNSKGTIFIDTAGAIKINEWGAYAQLSKDIRDKVTLTLSGRYDKNADFKGQFTPRATALVKISKDQNVRFSYQTAYRFAANTQKYIRLNVGSYTILGGLPWIMDYMKAPVHEIINNQPKAENYVYQPLKPESVSSFEAGYKALINQRLLIDVYGYVGQYKDFYGRNVLVDGNGKIYSTSVNSTTTINTHGFGAGLDYRLPKNYSIFFNGYTDVLSNVPSGFLAYFNTPKYRANLGFANNGFGKKQAFGFNVMARWQDAFFCESELANGPVDAFTTVDAQVSYKLPWHHGMLKLGGTNILNHYYKNSYGNPMIGGLYYVSLGFGL